MKIAILGYGVVGSGAYEVAQAAHNIESKTRALQEADR